MAGHGHARHGRTPPPQRSSCAPLPVWERGNWVDSRLQVCFSKVQCVSQKYMDIGVDEPPMPRILSCENTSFSKPPGCPVRFSYNPSFSACFFSRNSVFLSQQTSQNSVSVCFFSEANEIENHLAFAKKKKFRSCLAPCSRRSRT